MLYPFELRALNHLAEWLPGAVRSGADRPRETILPVSSVSWRIPRDGFEAERLKCVREVSANFLAAFERNGPWLARTADCRKKRDLRYTF
jgi:hypothetical protein